MKLRIQIYCTLDGRIHTLPDQHMTAIFPPSSEKPAGWHQFKDDNVWLSLCLESGQLFCMQRFDATRRMCDFLSKNQITVEEAGIWSDISFEWPDLLKKERRQMTESGITAVVNLHKHLKYHYDQYDLDETPSLTGSIYSIETDTEDDSPEFVLPPIPLFDAPTFTPITIDEELSKELSLLVVDREEPLIAMPHLHRAIKEHQPRHKWIDATIAAELAIKECLVTLRPELAPLLLRLPSPPPSTLYGKVMEEYLGEPSPVIKAIRKGERVRNELVHSPKDKTISDQDAAEYVKEIEFGILHLRSLLNPNDQWVQGAYQRERDKRNQSK